MCANGRQEWVIEWVVEMATRDRSKQNLSPELGFHSCGSPAEMEGGAQRRPLFWLRGQTLVRGLLPLTPPKFLSFEVGTSTRKLLLSEESGSL